MALNKILQLLTCHDLNTQHHIHLPGSVNRERVVEIVELNAYATHLGLVRIERHDLSFNIHW
jgi:hypothetical protein